MFLIVDILNEGKTANNQSKINQSGLSEGENPKSSVNEIKTSGWESTKTRACVNSNWEKLRR
jgi:hypothetical protein